MRQQPLLKYWCLRCGHRWTPRQETVRQCPKCKSASWDTRTDGQTTTCGMKTSGTRIWMRFSPTYNREQRDEIGDILQAFEAWMSQK